MATNETFSVLTGGAADSLDGISSPSDGDFAFGIVSGLMHSYVFDTSETGSENSPYQIKADDATTGSWMLVGFKGAMSHVDVSSSTGTLAMITNAWTTVVFETENKDTLSEYSTTTGLFTATYTGYYNVSSSIWLASAAWVANDLIGAAIILNSTRVKLGPRLSLITATYTAGNCVNGTIYATAGQTIGIQLYHNQGGNINLGASGAQVWLTIDRIA